MLGRNFKNVPNTVKDLSVATVRQEIKACCERHNRALVASYILNN